MFSESAWPSADDAARVIIAAALVDPQAAERVVELVTPDDFLAGAEQGDTYAAVFTAIANLVQRGRRPAPILVNEEIRRLGTAPKRHDGTTYDLGELLSNLAAAHSPAPVEEYCTILQRYGIRRRIRMAGHRLIDLANDDAPETAEYIPNMEAIVGEVAEHGQSGDSLERMGEVAAKQLTIHEQRQPGAFTGLRIGFTDLDIKLRGLQPGDLIILGARPSMGKSALAQNIGDFCARNGKTVVFVSREMQSGQLADRLLASEGGLNAGDLRAGLVPKDRFAAARDTLQKKGLFEAPYWIDRRSRTVPEIRASLLRVKRQYGLDLCVIDYLQLLNATGKYAKSGSRANEVGEISRSLKVLAGELEIPVLVLSQLSRALEQRGDKHPQLSDLRDSGDIEQDADIVAFLFRDDYYNPESAKKGITEVNIAKNRNGPLGTVELQWLPERTKFFNQDRRHV